MSAVPAGDVPSRKSFAQVAAAAHKPTVPQTKTSNQSETNKKPQLPEVRPLAPTVNHASILRQSPAKAQNGQIPAMNQINDMMKGITLDGSHLQSATLDNAAKRENSDTKSVTSRTTLTLDEKDSLRPDDSASMKAAAEEDASSPTESVAVEPKPNSDPDARAFRDQLHEIDRTETSRLLAQRPAPSQTHHLPAQPNGSIGLPAQQGPPVIHPDVMRSSNQASMPPPDFYMPPDEKLMEALASPKDRLFVLKIEQDLIDFIKDSKEQELLLPQTNSFYRMLSHKLAEYYFLGHLVDDSLSSVKIFRLPSSRLPPPLIGTEPKSEGTTPPPSCPTRKIMRRGTGAVDSPGRQGERNEARNSGSRSTTDQIGSGSDEEKDEPKDKSRMTREEREHRYAEARARIFRDYPEKSADSTEGNQGSSDKGISRSSSASGNKKGRKNRRPKDDSFEARSAYTQYGTQPYFHAPVQAQQENVFYAGLTPYAPFPGMPTTPSFTPDAQPLPAPTSQMPQQDCPGNFAWPGNQYSQTYTVPQNVAPQGQFSQPGFDTAGGYQYASPQVATQSTPKPHQPSPANYYENLQSQGDVVNWQQTGFPNYYTGPNVFTIGNMPGNFQNAFASQGFTAADPNSVNGQPSHNLSGQQFNPRSQAFVPRGGNVQYSANSTWSPMPTVMQPQAPSSPYNTYNSNYPSPQHPSSAQSRRPSSHRGQSNQHSQSTLSKWGNSSTLPAKPPPTASTLSFQVPQYTHNPQPLPNRPFANQVGHS